MREEGKRTGKEKKFECGLLKENGEKCERKFRTLGAVQAHRMKQEGGEHGKVQFFQAEHVPNIQE